MKITVETPQGAFTREIPDALCDDILGKTNRRNELRRTGLMAKAIEPIVKAFATYREPNMTCEYCGTEYAVPDGRTVRIERTSDMPPPARVIVHACEPGQRVPLFGIDPVVHECRKGVACTTAYSA